MSDGYAAIRELVLAWLWVLFKPLFNGFQIAFVDPICKFHEKEVSSTT